MKGLRSIAKVVLAAHAGFCFGVRRAVETAEQSAPALTLGSIIHNPQVIEDLERHGVHSYERVEDVPPGTTVVIRAHGVTRQVLAALEEANLTYVDATCPYVMKIHRMTGNNYIKLFEN